MNKYSEILKNWQAPDGLSEEEALQRIESRLGAKVPSSGGRVRQLWMAAVAVAAVAVMTWMIVMPNNRVIRDATSTAQSKSIALPDGSTVLLNACSEVQYNEDWSEKRQIQLAGEAFFEVKKGSTFEVITPQGAVRVLGTSFNVFCRDGAWHVACHTGRVEVQHHQEQVVLAPGQQVDLQAEHLFLSEFEVEQRTWRDGVYYYENQPLAIILEEMERQFAIEISSTDEVRAIEGVTTNFSRDDLSGALQTVALPMGLEFVRTGEKSYRLEKSGSGS